MDVGEEGEASLPTTLVSPRRAPMTSRLQSPTSQQFCLGSNDDQLERAQARAARTAAMRRKSLVIQQPLPLPSSDSDLLSEEHIMDLFNNCIKLASENKINQKNTWELGLIDHLSEIVRVRTEYDAETDFRKASCTLEAGVKIYSLRVDSVHSEAYKVLGGMNRAGREDEIVAHNDMGVAGDPIEEMEGASKLELERKTSPLSTLEPSFETLNVKKLDVSFTVDPLYHQTTAQFDEGGAKGLLLHNLGVYGGCCVLFDSFEIPASSLAVEANHEESEMIDLSFAKVHIDQMMKEMSAKNDITPTLRDILSLLDGDDCRKESSSFTQVESTHGTMTTNNDATRCDNFRLSSFDENDLCDNFESSERDHNFYPCHEESADYKFSEADMDAKLGEITEILSLSLGISTKSNAWAGPDHWKYQKARGPLLASALRESRKTISGKKEVLDIEFSRSLDADIPDIFVKPKSSKSLILQRNKVACNIRLPEDCHFKPESLVRLFFIPNAMIIRSEGRQLNDESRGNHFTLIDSFPWNNDYVINEDYDSGHNLTDADDSGPLVSQPPQVNKIEIQYDKVSKQVDVHALKEILWNHIQESIDISDKMVFQATTSFRQVLSGFSGDRFDRSGGNISPHMFFICLLHLANEYGLSIRGCHGWNDLDIDIPCSVLTKS